MFRTLARLAAAAAVAATLAFAPAAPVGAGEEAHITVAPLPRAAVVGKPVTVEFVVLDAARRPLDDLAPLVIATSDGRRVEAGAARVRAPRARGRYAADLVLPADGAWRIVVDSRYCGNTATAGTLAVRAAR
uniref:YtkA-like domain-containing protein n=1 Tax=Eiseniibacteriota bacterium TaxID=2212470 RepID=A0A832HZV4_UNCEI